jgi:hypothetical protein
MKLLKIFALLSLVTWASPTFATFIFTDVNYTSNSVSFTIDGNMSGYNSPGSQLNIFSLRYVGDIWSGLETHSSNIWNQSVFQNHNILTDQEGNTGGFENCCASTEDYSFSKYDVVTLSDATASNRQIVLTMGDHYLNTAATSGTIEFLWGSGANHTSPVVIDTWATSTTVPEPGTLALFGIGLFGMGLARRKKT